MCPYRTGNPDFTTNAFLAHHSTLPARQQPSPSLPPPRSFHVSTPPASFPPSPSSLDAARFFLNPTPHPAAPPVASATATDMASSANPPTLSQLQALLGSMINTDLKEICRAEKLKVSGVKSQLQSNIYKHFSDLLRQNDMAGARRVLDRARNPGQPLPSPTASTPGRISAPVYPESPTRGLSQQHHTPSTTNLNSRPRQPTFPSRVSFKKSPFYDVLDTIAPAMDVQIYPSNRGSTQSQFQLAADIAARLKTEKDLRIMLFSATEPVLAPFTSSDISFPVNIEVKVNGQEVKANFKGLKNKPGSTRPADITDFVRAIPNYTNHIQITYALTQKKFIIVANLVRKHSVANLTDRISRGSVLSKERVVSEMLAKAKDDDIVVNSQVVSLRDPVAGVRIQLPCRSTVCSHSECFDATYFLQLQEQAPTWTCPCCSKTLSFEALVVDKYMQDILDKTPEELDHARIYPDGTWTPGTGDKNESKANGVKAPVNDDDDDLVEISPRQMGVKKETSNTPLRSVNTPPVSSREPSSASVVAPTGSNGKRKHQEVVDLTLSDSDEEPRRPAKRYQPTYSTPSSMSDRYRQQPVVPNGHYHPSQSPNSVSSSHSHPGHAANRHHGYNVGDQVGMPRARHSLNGPYPESSGYGSNSWLNGHRDYQR